MPVMKVDIFCHIFPKNFYDRMLSSSGAGDYMQKRVRGIPSMIDLDVRFRIMDRFPEYVQVISLAAPPIEALGSKANGRTGPRSQHDGMALVTKHPDRFLGIRRITADERR